MQVPASPDDVNADRPNRIHWPPILYVLTLGGAWLLDWLIPLPPVLFGTIARGLGWGLFAIGLAIGLAGILEFRRQGTPFDPTAPAEALATDGIYRFTRNPMYLGALLAFTGLSLALRWTWLLLLVPPLWLALTRLAIVREEAYLARRFGTRYAEYQAHVRRWV